MNFDPAENGHRSHHQVRPYRRGVMSTLGLVLVITMSIVLLSLILFPQGSFGLQRLASNPVPAITATD